jgi:hypothetical protein
MGHSFLQLMQHTGPPDDNPAHPLKFFKDRLRQLPADDFFPDTRYVELTQGTGSVLKVTVSKFAPRPGDKTAYEWITPQGERRMEMLPYCISDIAEAEVNMRDYARQSTAEYLIKLVDRSNRIVVQTFNLAIKSKVIMAAACFKRSS